MDILIAVFIGLAAFFIFSPALLHDFINWDDDYYVLANSFIRSLDWQMLKSSFGSFYVCNWHPLAWISHALDYAVWGLNPLGHHLTNTIFHSLNTAIVVLLVIRLLEIFRKADNTSKNATPFLTDRTIRIAGVTTGLLFGLHPLHVESVVWVAERKDLLCAFFFLLSVYAYTYYPGKTRADGTTRYSKKPYLLALGMFALALMSKPMAVTLPVTLLILDWSLFKRIHSWKSFGITFAEKIPFFVLSLISSILTVLAQEASGSIRSFTIIPLISRIVVSAKSLIAYLMKMVLPLHLVPYYPYPDQKSISFFSLEYIVPIIMVTAITAVCLITVRTRKLWMSAWGYYVITLMPVLGIIQVGDQAMADRYTYLPSLGPFLVIGLAVAKAYSWASTSSKHSMPLRTGVMITAVTILTLMSWTTIKQIGIWKNSIIFWNYVIEKEPGKIPIAYSNLGNAYSASGLNDKAIEQYQIALRLSPNYAEAHFNLGLIYLDNGSPDKARHEFEKGLKIKPNDDKARGILDSLLSK